MKKIVALLLTGVMTLSLLAGCGSNGGNDSSDGNAALDCAAVRQKWIILMCLTK